MNVIVWTWISLKRQKIQVFIIESRHLKAEKCQEHCKNLQTWFMPSRVQWMVMKFATSFLKPLAPNDNVKSGQRFYFHQGLGLKWISVVCSVGTRALEDSAQDGSLYNLRILQLFFGSFNPKWWVINYSDSCTVGILWKNISGCSQKQSGTIPTGPSGDGWRTRTSWQNEITGFIYFLRTCFNVTFDTFYRAQQVSTYVDYYHVNNDNNDKYQPRHSLQGMLEK